MSFKEKHLEDYIVKGLEESGWTFVEAENLEREDYAEPLLVIKLVRMLEKLNPEADDKDVKRTLNELKLTTTGPEGIRKVLGYYKTGIPIKFEKDKTIRFMKLFDFENPDLNDFIVSRQVIYKGKETIRTDIMLYVNAIPLVNIECKNPADTAESWYTAFKDIKYYEKIVPELYKYVQIGVAAESSARYFPIVPWQENVRIYEWKDKNEAEEEPDSVDSTIKMLEPEKLLDLLRFFLFYREENREATKVIARYMQLRTANKIVKRNIDRIEGKSSKSNGLIWHWQGSGKTLTMIFAAYKLFHNRKMENPTIFFIIDRRELEIQLNAELNALDMDTFTAEPIGSIFRLKEILSSDRHRGKRGAFITLIHKFSPEEIKSFFKEIKNDSSSYSILNRKNVTAFIDEGHRSQYGLLALQMKQILKNASFFAFTGTPISINERDTYQEFAYPEDDELFLDKYSVLDSIHDGYTVSISYQPRLKNVGINKESLDTFINSELEALPEVIRDNVASGLEEKLDNVKLFLENSGRISDIAKDIAEHFKENVNGKFKALVATTSRLASVYYKKELDAHLPFEWSEIVMSYSQKKDKGYIRSYYELLVKRNRGKEIEKINEDTIRDFKEKDNPRILIVTDMLLTGFDAPILQTIYLDKLLKGHRLLQTIARTNRPYKDLKEAGMIIDYVGILKEFNKAFENYSKEDIERVLLDYDNLIKKFEKQVEELSGILEGITLDFNRETLVKAFRIITTNKKKEKTFVEKYKNLRRLFELLGTEEIKLEYFDFFKWVTGIYNYYQKMTSQSSEYETELEQLFRRTVKFIYQNTEVEKLDKEIPVIKFDENYLLRLNELIKNKAEKVTNIMFVLNKIVITDRRKNPVYESLVKRVEDLLSLWREKVENYEELFKQGVDIIETIINLGKRQYNTGFERWEYGVLLTLEENIDENVDFEKDVRALSKIIKGFIYPGWIYQTGTKKNIEREVRRFVRKIKARYELSIDEMNRLYEKTFDKIKNFGI